MRVALLTARLTPDHGWGRYTLDLVTALAAQGVDIDLIAASDSPPTTDLPVRSYHRVLPSLTPAPRLSSLRLLARLPIIHRLTAGADVVHVAAEPYAICVPPSRPLVVTAHGTFLPLTLKNQLLGDLYRRSYRRARISCVSAYTEKRVKVALPDARTVIIPNAVNVQRFQQPVAALPDKSGPTLLSVGVLKPRKGYHVIVQAMSAIRAAIPDACTVFIGSTSDNTYYLQLVEQAQRAGLTDAIQMPGKVPDATLLGWLHAADVFVLHSLNVGDSFEGFGLAYLEASAAGLPVIGTRDCGAEDAIVDGETGLLVPQRDSVALADAAIRLLRDTALRQRMGERGQAFAAQHSWDRAAGSTLDLYRV